MSALSKPDNFNSRVEPKRESLNRKLNLVQERPSGRILYCIAYMVEIPGDSALRRPPRWEGRTMYLHAFDAGDARWQYMNSEPPEKFKQVHITGIAPVIGMKVHDNHGDKLSI